MLEHVNTHVSLAPPPPSLLPPASSYMGSPHSMSSYLDSIRKFYGGEAAEEEVADNASASASASASEDSESDSDSIPFSSDSEGEGSEGDSDVDYTISAPVRSQDARVFTSSSSEVVSEDGSSSEEEEEVDVDVDDDFDDDEEEEEASEESASISASEISSSLDTATTTTTTKTENASVPENIESGAVTSSKSTIMEPEQQQQQQQQEDMPPPTEQPTETAEEPPKQEEQQQPPEPTTRTYAAATATGGGSGGGSSMPSLPTVQRPRPTASAAAAAAPTQTQEVVAASQTQQQRSNDPRLSELHTYMRDLRIKWMRIASRLGKNDRHSVVAQVLYRINLAEERIADKLTRAPGTQPTPRRGPAQAVESFKPDTGERAEATELENTQGESAKLGVTITILMLGKAGTGKTETLRALLAEDPNADVPSADASGDGTSKPYVATGTVKGIELRVIDTPGLRTGAGDAATNQNNLRKVKTLTKKYKPDIVLYFDRHDIPSPNVAADVPLLWAITETFGSSLWYHAILVFTHAASMPPENNGQQIQYDLYKQRRTQISQNLVRQLSGNPGLMNPVSCVENSPKVRRNRAGEACLPDGTAWLPYLLLLISGSALLADANAKLQIWNLRNENEVGYGKLLDGEGGGVRGLLKRFGPRVLAGHVMKKVKGILMIHDKDAGGLNPLQRLMRQQQPPPMPFLLSNLITSRKPKKRDEGMLDKPPKSVLANMKVADRANLLKDIREQKEQELLESDEKITVPAPDTPMPPTFDAENLNAHRYRHLEGFQRWQFRPILDQQAYDHEDGVEGVTLDRMYNGFSLPDTLGGRRRWPCSLSGQLQKDKKSYSLTLDGEGTVHYGLDGEKGRASTTYGFDLQTVGDKEMLRTVRADARYKIMQGLKMGLGGNMCELRGQNYGYKAEARLRPMSWAKFNVAAGMMKSRVDKIPDAHGMNLELLLRSPLQTDTRDDEPQKKNDPFQLAMSASFMKWRNEVAKGMNINGQMLASSLIPDEYVGDTLVGMKFNLNSRSTGQLTMRLSSQESNKLGYAAVMPLVIALWGRITDP